MGGSNKSFGLPDLRRLSARGGFYTAAAQAGSYALQLVATAFLARILLPEDFGVVMMVTASVSLLGYVAVDFGLTDATIQKKELEASDLSGLFWTSVCAGTLVAVLSIAAAPFLAWFYGDSRVTMITVAIAPSFLLQGMAVQHRALLSREMRFGAVSLIQVFSVLAGVAVALVAAVAGAGYWSLVMQPSAMNLAAMVAAWSFHRWRPGMLGFGSGLRWFLRFGRDLTLFNLLSRFSRMIDRIVVGKTCGAADLGYYTRASALLLIPLGQIILPMGKVVVPVLSRLQDDAPRLRRYFARIANIVGLTTFLPIAILAALAEEVVLVLLGPNWLPSVEIFRILSLAVLARVLHGMITWVSTALGRSRQLRRWSLISLPTILICVLAGSRFGMTGVAVSYSIASFLTLSPGLHLLVKFTPVTGGDIVRSMWRPLLLGILLYGVVSAARMWLSDLDAWLCGLAAAVLGTALTAPVVLFWKEARREVAEVLLLVREAGGREASSGPAA